MSEYKSIDYIKFLIMALGLGFIFMCEGELSDAFNIANLDILLKIVIIIGLLALIQKRGDFKIFNFNFSPLILLLIFIPAIFSIVLQVCPLDFIPYPEYVATVVIGTVTTAIWEELFFRYYGCSIFEENWKFRWYNILFLAIAFSSGHLFNMAFDGFTATFHQLIFTIGLGVFCLALYIHTKSIIPPIIAHFIVNSISDYYTVLATEEAQAMAYIGNLADPVLYIYVIVLIAVGFIVLKKYDHLA